MRWRELTSPDFAKAVKATGVCVLSVGCLEKYFDHLPPGYTPIWWYADNPDHYCGDATGADAEKGRKLRGLLVDSLADYIRAVKNDEVTPALLDEFYDRSDKVDAG